MAEKMATRQAYGKALVEIGAENPNLVVMDADLSKSIVTSTRLPAFFICCSMRTGTFWQACMCIHIRNVRCRQSF